MATGNDTHPTDKVVMEKPPIKMAENVDELNVHEKAWQLMSSTVSPERTMITEVLEIHDVGCVQRDTVITPQDVNVTTCFVDGVRAVEHTSKITGEPDGLRYMHKHWQQMGETNRVRGRS
ncbi:hypothetical protein CL634_00670 [bacterium]|nr:hypothetical protein [bacterium]|tara:strand:- start:560 stop:919 length:360 start_codon:yes stop_codon:yes gene_type:complete